MANQTIFPFHGLNDDDLTDILSDSYIDESILGSLVFDPLCSYDSYSRDVDPDFGLSNSRPMLNSEYHDISNLEDSYLKNNNAIKIICQNIRSMKKNFEEFYLDFEQLNIDILALTETWMSDDSDHFYKKYANYNGAFKNRMGNAGGVGFLISDSHQFDVINDISVINDEVETIFIKVKIGSKTLIFGNIYRPPRGSKAEFLISIERFLTFCRTNYGGLDLYLMGDFNIDLLKMRCPDVESYVNTMYSYDLSPMICRPTRVAGSSYSIIDHIWTNDQNVLASGIIRTRITDHYTIFVTISKDHEESDNFTEITYRQFTERNKSKFASLISEIDWEPLLAMTEVEALYSRFSDVLCDAFKSSFPLIKRKKRLIDVKKPYIDENIRGLIKEKHRILKLYNKYPISYRERYREIRNRVNSAVQAAERRYYFGNLSDSERNPRRMWNVLNEMMGRNPKLSSQIPEMMSSEGLVTGNIPVANVLNKYFSGIGQNLSSAINESTRNDFNRYLIDPTENRFEFERVTGENIIKIVAGLNNTSGGYDQLPMFIFKDNIENLCQVIAHICNQSLSQGIFPSELSIARVTCIFKGGCRREPCNYRPISLLPAFSKIIEKTVEINLFEYMDRNKLFSENQYGFRRGRSTEHAVHSMIRYIHSSFDQNKIALGIFLDIKKAFDCLDRNILMDKLRYYGITGKELDWFSSYLRKRQQYTVVDQSSSSLSNVNFGVPQGGILSPILFLIYVNDIGRCSDSGRSVLFADDTNLVMSGSNIPDLFQIARESLVEYKRWFDANGLTLNATKTKYILFQRKQRHLPIFDQTLELGGVEIERVSNVKFLGVIVDQYLDWSSHISNLSRKLAKYVGIIWKIRKLCTGKSLKLIYHSLIYSNLIYCNSVWGHCKMIALRPLEVVHKKIIRAVDGAHRMAHTNEIFERLSLLSLSNINRYMVAIFVYKCINSREFSELFNYRVIERNTRSSDRNLLFIPRIYNVHSEQSIDYRGPYIWNQIPPDISSQNYDSFKLRLKFMLINN